MLTNMWRAVSDWYDRHYLATLVITTAAFVLQIFHLYWLFTAVILKTLTGESYFVFPENLTIVYVIADYLEIPALISTTFLYIADLRKGPKTKAILYIFLLNTQWLHLFWITDSIVVQTLSADSVIAWNSAIAWVAILIDYLEVPVILEMLRKIYDERAEIGHRVRVRLANTEG